MCKKTLLLASFLYACHLLVAQKWDASFYTQRMQVIDSLFNDEQYQKVLPIAEQHLKWMQTEGVNDSVYKIIYTIARSVWKTKNALAGQKRGEEIMRSIERNDKDTLHHLLALNDLSWLYYETGNDSLCLVYDQRYLQVSRTWSKSTTEHKANAHYNIGFDYMALGKTQLAFENWQQSLDVLLLDPNAKISTIIKTYNAIGSTHYRIGDFIKAKEHYFKSLEYATRITDLYEKHSNSANSYGNLSLIAKDEGNFIQAKSDLEKSIAHRKQALNAAKTPNLKQQEQDQTSKAYHNLASIYMGIGDFARCEQLLMQTKAEKEKILEDDDPRQNIVYEGLAKLYAVTGEFGKALENSEIYKQSCIKHYGYESFWTGFAYKSEAYIYAEMKDYGRSEASYKTAITILEKTEDDESGKELANCYMHRAEALHGLQRENEAILDIEKSIVLFSSQSIEAEQQVGRNYIFMAEVKLAQKDIAGAEKAIDIAISQLENYAKRNAPHGGRLASLVPNLPEAYHTRARVAEAQSGDRKQMEIAFQDANKAVEIVRSNANVFDQDVSQLMHYASYEPLFSYAQAMCHRLYAMTGEPQYVEKFLQLSEENRTVMLRRQLSSFSSIAFANVPDSIAQKENDLQRSLRSDEDLTTQPEKLLEREREYDQLIEQIKKEQPQYYALKYNQSVANVQQIQNELVQEGTSLLEYIVTEDNVYALVITKHKYHILQLAKGTLAADIEAYNLAITSNNEQKASQLSFALYQRLFEPLISFFDGNEIMVVPDNELFNLNFETLRKSVDGGLESYLINDYIISYLLSATTALQFGKLNTCKEAGVLAIAPGFSDELKQSYAARKDAYSFFDDSFLKRIQQPFAVRTAKSIASMLDGKAYTDQLATEQNFREDAQRYGIIHFGTHTEINNLSPLMSRLILTNAANDSTENDDGYLHAYEIYNMQLRAELAVLTACQTGNGKPNSSEGVLSLAHSFAYAGCPSVVMSVWQIDEKTSAIIIEKFYQNLADGMNKNEALRQAKLSYLKENPGELSAPYYWAGMVLLGDTQPLQSSQTSFWWWIAGGIGFLALFGLFLRKRMV